MTDVDDPEYPLVGFVLGVDVVVFEEGASETLGLVVELPNNGFVEYIFVGFLLAGGFVLTVSSRGLHVTRPGGNSVGGTLDGLAPELYLSPEGLERSVVGFSVVLGRGLYF